MEQSFELAKKVKELYFGSHSNCHRLIKSMDCFVEKLFHKWVNGEVAKRGSRTPKGERTLDRWFESSFTHQSHV